MSPAEPAAAKTPAESSRPDSVDIVIPVFNALAHLRDCVDSLLADTQRPPGRILIVDDGSDRHTAGWLDRLAEARREVEVLRNVENSGFLQSANRGMSESKADFVVLLNSDTVVPEAWLRRMVECAVSDPRIGSVNPLSSRAAHLEIPIPAGYSFLSLDQALANCDVPPHDAVTGVGFCLLLRRQALQQVGLFDHVFGRGYCEESDLCMRLTAAGWRTVATPQVYVYHRGAASFADRNARYLANRRIFDGRWKAEYRRQFAAFRRSDPLPRMRRQLAGPQRWQPLPQIWASGRQIRAAMAARRPLDVARAAVRGLLALPRSTASRPQRSAMEDGFRAGRLRVVYLLDRIVVAGGVLSVLQLVNALNLRGIEARVAGTFLDPAVRDWMPLYSEPMVFKDAAELSREFPSCDVVVATHWNTAEWAARLLETGRARHGAYFIQDYEPWFFPKSATAERQQVRAGFALLPHRIVKSQWLAELLETDGYSSVRIPLGLNLDIYYPRDVERRLRILAMARPGTPRRGFDTLRQVLAEVRAQRPQVEIGLFGSSDLTNAGLTFGFEDHGVVADQQRLAELYSGAAVFVDASDFQGFGRCALEAMACGSAVVVTGVGGVSTYARDGETALVTAPRDVAAMVSAVLRLIDDTPLLESLAVAGRAEAQRFCHRQEASATRDHLQGIAGAAAGVRE